jgi:ankyrin repeat protein
LNYIRKYGVHERDSGGNTALHRAAMYYDNATIEVLLKEGADIEARNVVGFTPLHLAVMGDSYNTSSAQCKKKSIEILLKHGADINTQADDGKTPLNSILMHRNAFLTEFLIMHGADVNIKDKYGFTALHYAVLNQDGNDFELILEQADDLNVRSNYGITPLHLAVSFHNRGAAESLLENGADSCLTDICGNKPIHYMSDSYDSELVMLLSEYDKTQDPQEEDFLVVSSVESAFLLTKQMVGAAFYLFFPETSKYCCN